MAPTKGPNHHLNPDSMHYSRESPPSVVAQLSHRINGIQRLFVLTGAGCSTASGIPDYRDLAGEWKLTPPVQWHDFVNKAVSRQRYWARSLIGWPRFHNAAPAPAHQALADLDQTTRMNTVVTQNVDDLHRRAGSRNIINLHGLLSEVVCLGCGEYSSREHLQGRLAACNPELARTSAPAGPDGDALLANSAAEGFSVPNCLSCGGLLKPNVVFFGQNVPKSKVKQAMDELTRSDALLVVGSSVMVFSGYRFCRHAKALGKPLYIINRGRTRADAQADLKIDGDCNQVLPQLVQLLNPPA